MLNETQRNLLFTMIGEKYNAICDCSEHIELLRVITLKVSFI